MYVCIAYGGEIYMYVCTRVCGGYIYANLAWGRIYRSVCKLADIGCVNTA